VLPETDADELQADREALFRVLGLEDVLMFGCPDNLRPGGEFITVSAKNYMKTGKSLISISFVEWLRSRSRGKLSSAMFAEAVVHIQRGDVNPCGRWKDRYLPSSYYHEVAASVAIFSEKDSIEPSSEFPSPKYSLRLDTNASDAWIAAATAQYVERNHCVRTDVAVHHLASLDPREAIPRARPLRGEDACCAAMQKNTFRY
jgi:hypothetical protein